MKKDHTELLSNVASPEHLDASSFSVPSGSAVEQDSLGTKSSRNDEEFSTLRVNDIEAC